jgi:hypothetical protein
MVIGTASQAGLARKLVKGAPHGGTLQRPAVVRDQKAGYGVAAKHPIPPLRVLDEHSLSGAMKGYQARLAELTVTDREQPLMQIDILSSECEGLTNAESGYRQ